MLSVVELYLSGMSIPEVSDNTGSPRSTVRHRLHKAGVLRSREDGVRNSGQRGRLGGGIRGKKRIFTEAHRKAMSIAKIIRANKYAAGISLKPSGYIEITRGVDKSKSQHRMLMEKHLGRELRHDEHVHHKDGNRSNNDMSNLEVMSAHDHMSHHAKENIKNRMRNSNGTWR